MSADYFGNEVVAREPCRLRRIVRCGCGCGESGCIADDAEGAFAARVGEQHRGARLVLEGHGEGLKVGGATFYLGRYHQVLYDTALTEGERLELARASIWRGPSETRPRA